MAGKVKPEQVRRTREAFGLNASQFAAVLGVHPTTVSRWENADRPVEVDGMAWMVLTGLANRLGGARSEAAPLGKRIAEALVVDGAIAALAQLVAFAAGADHAPTIWPSSMHKSSKRASIEAK